MPNRERQRDRVMGSIDPELLRQRQANGWRMVAIEWERDSEHPQSGNDVLEVPFGLRVAGDCHHLEEHPVESEILRTVMRGVVNDHPLSQICQDLNNRGYRTRSGELWNPANVFDLMPSLVDNGPRIFSDPEWPARRQSA